MQKPIFLAVGLAIISLGTAPVSAGETPSAAGAKAYFINLKDGDTVTSPVKIQFGLSGMGVAPAGTAKANTGHHHLIIDEKIDGDELNENIPSDAKHKHFGKGQTETMVKLTPGKRTLQLVLGDQNHIPHNKPVMSERITVTVK